jgi:hypothetical protein
MARPVAAQAVPLAAAPRAVKQAGSLAAAPAALQADAVASQAGAAVAAVVSLGAAVLKSGVRRLRRTLNPRSSFYPPPSVFRR